MSLPIYYCTQWSHKTLDIYTISRIGLFPIGKKALKYKHTNGAQKNKIKKGNSTRRRMSENLCKKIKK